MAELSSFLLFLFGIAAAKAQFDDDYDSMGEIHFPNTHVWVKPIFR